MFNFLKRKNKFKPELRIIDPRISFKITCKRNKLIGYVGFDIKNPLTANRGAVTCPICHHAYNLRVKENAKVGDILKAGSRHEFTITQITLTPTERLY